MYTTFGSFKKAGACRDGNQRFLRMIGDSSHNLSGLDHKIPVWLPLIMNPNDGEDISWMFNPALTFVHDEKDFRHLFDVTRDLVLRYGLLSLLFSIHAQHQHGSFVWEFVTGTHSHNIKANKEKARALIDIATEITRVLRPETSKTDDQLRSAWRKFERLCGTHIHPRTSDPNRISSPNGQEYMTTSLTDFNNLYGPLRMAVMEPDAGDIQASIVDQLYYAHFVLHNALALNKWTFGLGIEFDDKPGKKNRQRTIEPKPEKPVKRPRETASAFSMRLSRYMDKLEIWEAYNKKTKETVNKSDDPLDLIYSLWEHPALFSFKCYFVGERDVEAATKAKPTRGKTAAVKARVVKKTRRSESEYDDEDDLSIEHNYDTETGEPLSEEAKAKMRDVFEEYDRQYATSQRVAKAYRDDKRNWEHENGKPKFDRFNRRVLDTLSYVWTNDPKKWVVDWVHDNFDTHLFFDSLRARNEKAMPENITVDFLASQEKQVSVHVARTETGEFTTGLIAVNSPRVLLQVMKALQEIGENAVDADLTPSTERRRSFRERMIAAAQERNREALDELAAQPELAPAPVLEDPVPVATMPSPAPVVQLADAVFGRETRRSSRGRAASMN